MGFGLLRYCEALKIVENKFFLLARVKRSNILIETLNCTMVLAFQFDRVTFLTVSHIYFVTDFYKLYLFHQLILTKFLYLTFRKYAPPS